MLLVGNINFDNLTYDAKGMVGETEVSFVLPQRLHRRSLLKLKYFGYHAGISADNNDASSLEYAVASNDATGRTQYMWRGAVKEVNMRIAGDGVNIMHGNVSTHYRDDVDKERFNSVENKDYISFPVSKEVLAASIVSNAINENNPSKPIPVARGHSQFYDMGLGYVEESTSEIKVSLHALHVFIDELSRFSQEMNVRMDTISFILELQ
jgi:hypothetical protein